MENKKNIWIILEWKSVLYGAVGGTDAQADPPGSTLLCICPEDLCSHGMSFWGENVCVNGTAYLVIEYSFLLMKI